MQIESERKRKKIVSLFIGWSDRTTGMSVYIFQINIDDDQAKTIETSQVTDHRPFWQYMLVDE